MRDREEILTSLERAYREAFQRADDADDADAMHRLDFDFQRDQVWLEVLLDLRDALADPPEAEPRKGLLDQAKALRDLTRR
ncbi:MAG: hypothetical protein PVI57_20095 [Gemmatimonadota bacterium]|jgi:hypothetical protein